MVEVLGLAAVLAVLGAVMAVLALLAARVRRRAIGMSLLGVVDELYHPAAHEARTAIVITDQRTGRGRRTGAAPTTDDTETPGT